MYHAVMKDKLKAKEPFKDPFPTLPREPGLARRFKPVDYGCQPIAVEKPLETFEPVAKASASPVEGQVAPTAAELPKRKAGRPVAPKPWLAEGVSRMTWYRRKKWKPE